MADAFNAHFSEIAGRATSNITGPIDPATLLHHTSNSFIFLYPTNGDVKISWRDSNPQLLGIDKVTPEIIKLATKVVAQPISTLINLSFEEGTFPSALKVAVTSPVHKARKRNIMGN